MMSNTPDLAETLTNTIEQFRSLAEKSVKQSKDSYDQLRRGIEDAQNAFKDTVENGRKVSGELSLKAIADLRANADVALSHLEDLAGAKTPSEIVELQFAYLRRHAELSIEQAKEFQAFALKAAEEVAEPVKPRPK